jgi:hypothetical protein
MTDFVRDEKLLLGATIVQCWPGDNSVQCSFDDKYKWSVKIAEEHLRCEDGSLFCGCRLLYRTDVFVQVTFQQDHPEKRELSYILIPGHDGEFGVQNCNLSRPTAAAAKAPAQAPPLTTTTPTAPATPAGALLTTTLVAQPSTKIVFKKGDLVRLVGCAGEAGRKKLANFYCDGSLFSVIGSLIGKTFFVEIAFDSAEYYECRLDAKNGDEYQFHADWLELVCSDFSRKKEQAQSDLEKAMQALDRARTILQAAQKIVDLANTDAFNAQTAVTRCRENIKQFQKDSN